MVRLKKKRLCLLLLSTHILSAAVISAPVVFEQRGPQLFTARLASWGISFTPDRVRIQSPAAAVAFRFLGANQGAHLEGVGRPGRSNYLLAGYYASFPVFSSILYRSLYRGVDLAVYGDRNRIEYDLVLAPGISENGIEYQIEGAKRIRAEESGDLIVETAEGPARQGKPIAYQIIHGRKVSIASHYILKPGMRIGFTVGRHDRRLPLIIDPVLVYTKYFGGSGLDFSEAVAVDSQGFVYVAGETSSADFPAVNAFQPHPAAMPLWVSSDEGRTFITPNLGAAIGIMSLAATPDGKILFGETPTGIIKSTDGGATWFSLRKGPTALAGGLAVHPTNSDIVYAGTMQGLYKSVDGDDTWSNIHDAEGVFF